jgi:hypothetical protein
MSGNAYLPARVSRLDDPLGFLGVADSNRFHARLLGGIVVAAGRTEPADLISA